MSTTTLIPVGEYLRLTGKPNREYRDGVLFPKPMATWSHGVLQGLLVAMLSRLGFRAGSEISVRISAQIILIPDVIATRIVQKPYPTEPVELCCEILSPGDSLAEVFNKCEEYHDWGVPFCWVLDPAQPAAWEYHSGSQPLQVTDRLRAGGISIDLAELFAVLD